MDDSCSHRNPATSHTFQNERMSTSSTSSTTRGVVWLWSGVLVLSAATCCAATPGSRARRGTTVCGGLAPPLPPHSLPLTVTLTHTGPATPAPPLLHPDPPSPRNHTRWTRTRSRASPRDVRRDDRVHRFRRLFKPRSGGDVQPSRTSRSACARAGTTTRSVVWLWSGVLVF